MGSFAHDRSTSLLLGVEVSVEVQVVDGWLDVNVAARLARLLDGGDTPSQRERAESRLNILEVVVDVLGLLLWHAGQLLLSSGDLGLDLLELLKGGEFLFTLLLLSLSELLTLELLLWLLWGNWAVVQLLLSLSDLLLDLSELLALELLSLLSLLGTGNSDLQLLGNLLALWHGDHLLLELLDHGLQFSHLLLSELLLLLLTLLLSQLLLNLSDQHLNLSELLLVVLWGLLTGLSPLLLLGLSDLLLQLGELLPFLGNELLSLLTSWDLSQLLLDLGDLP